MKTVIDCLEERGFIDSLTTENIREITKQPIKVYAGFDPTNNSLHVGNLVTIIGLSWFQRFGHTPIALIGGATGMIGDPSGKDTERNLLSQEQIKENIKGIEKNLSSILNFQHKKAPAQLINNYDWIKDFSYLNFLRDIGKHFRLGQMIAKESVRSRLESDVGMSYTEFSYQILQAYDFFYLFQNKCISMQIGGSDQWGNITAGTELIRKLTGKSASGITFPLLTRSDGKKFGKSEKGAIWLSPDKLSPYEFYQYIFRTLDEDVIKLMRMLTFMNIEEIRHYEKMMKQTDYIPNTSQKRLAQEVTKIVHGEQSLKIALNVTENAAPGSYTSLDAKNLEKIANDMPTHTLKYEDVIDAKIIEIMLKIKLVSSKGEARRLIKNGGVYLNNQQVKDENFIIKDINVLDNKFLVIGIGKKTKVLIQLNTL